MSRRGYPLRDFALVVIRSVYLSPTGKHFLCTPIGSIDGIVPTSIASGDCPYFKINNAMSLKKLQNLFIQIGFKEWF